MANTTFIVGILFATLASFMIWLGYKLLIPAWNLSVNALANQYNTIVPNITFQNAFASNVVDLNIIVQYSFFIMLLGVVAVFLVIFSYRRHNTSESAAY